jgi:poly(3-hydroxybutyrate) depolymerase
MWRDKIDPHRVFVIGASAGANMATIMAVTYPELYAAVGSLVGCPYDDCGDPSGEVAFTTMGPRARRMPAFVVDGEADELNPFADSQNVVEEYLGVADLADDGRMNDSVSRRPASVFDHVSPVGASGDPCVRPMEFPCLGGVAGFKGSYPYSVFTYRDRAGHSVVEFFLIHGLGHDYPGGDPKGTFTDPLGPDITSAAYSFFAGHPRR